MTKEKIITELLRFAPRIVGECPKCGNPIFEGFRCFGCGFDASDTKLNPIDWENLE